MRALFRIEPISVRALRNRISHLELSESAAVFALAVAFMKYVALFQIIDGAHAVVDGMLRELQDTKIPILVVAISYWAVGMPVGLLLAFTYRLEGPAMWLGLASGLVFVALALLERWLVVKRYINFP